SPVLDCQHRIVYLGDDLFVIINTDYAAHIIFSLLRILFSIHYNMNKAMLSIINPLKNNTGLKTRHYSVPVSGQRRRPRLPDA
ncbi:MAG: hypothetical protein L0Y73_00035, partial [Candidatus Aminicenantes bacterium]|nr:hypothetical protein [Candidatus Aminicenantes bacterium]